MNKDIFEGQWKQVRGRSQIVGGANSPTMTWIGLPASTTSWWASSRKSMATPANAAANEIDKHVTEYEAGLKKVTA